jgi:hypothetical protein
MAEDSLFEKLVRPFISAPAKNSIERRPNFMRLFLMLAPEAGIVTHLLKQDCGPDEQEHLKKTPEQERLDRQFRCGGSRRFWSKVMRPDVLWRFGVADCG